MFNDISLERSVKVEFKELDILNELKCIICHNIPAFPLQCKGCDSIVCVRCTTLIGKKYKCPIRCKDQEYMEIKPKTRLLFDTVSVPCTACNNSVNLLELHNHYNKCQNDITSQPIQIKTETDTIICIDMTNKSHIIKQKKKKIPLSPIQRDGKWFFRALLIGIFSFLILLFTTYLALNMIFLSNNGNIKYICIAENLYSISGIDDICIFSFGFISFGVFSFGLISVGLFSCGIAVIGIFSAIGLAVVSFGFVPYSKVAIGAYIMNTQIGLALIKIEKAICGLHCFYSLYTKEEYMIENY